MKAMGCLWILLLTSCAASNPGGESRKETVMVRNANWLDVNVYAMSVSTVRQRVGTVGSSSATAFEISLSGPSFRLLIDPIGSDDQFLTDEIALSPRQMIVLEVAPNLLFSNWYVVDISQE